MRVLVDTNIYLELLLDREKANITENFFLKCISLRNQIYVTSMSLRDIEYTAHKALHDKEKSKKIQFLAYKMSSKVISISADAAIESIYSDNLDYEDSLQMNAAEEAMVDAIITFDKKGYKGSKLPVFTPEEILKIWNKA